MNDVVLACIAFVGTHFLLSHPLRRPVVGAIGLRGFLILYSLVAFALLGWIGWIYSRAPATPPLWPVGDALWALGTAITLVASVLLMGSLLGNPALPTQIGVKQPVPEARGVFAVTRHPMMWGFALWGGVHVLVYPVAANIVVASAMIVLALVGAAFQDRKKERLQPDFWPEWEGRTSYWPFAAIAGGRAKFGGFRPHDWAGGVVIWLAASWAHIPLSGWAAGVWKWIG